MSNTGLLNSSSHVKSRQPARTTRDFTPDFGGPLRSDVSVRLSCLRPITDSQTNHHVVDGRVLHLHMRRQERCVSETHRHITGIWIQQSACRTPAYKQLTFHWLVATLALGRLAGADTSAFPDLLHIASAPRGCRERAAPVQRLRSPHFSTRICVR